MLIDDTVQVNAPTRMTIDALKEVTDKVAEHFARSAQSQRIADILGIDVQPLDDAQVVQVAVLFTAITFANFRMVAAPVMAQCVAMALQDQCMLDDMLRNVLHDLQNDGDGV